MLIVLIGVCIVMVVVGIIMINHADYSDDALGIAGGGTVIIGGIGALVAIIAVIVQIHMLVEINVVDEKIAMYEEQNSKIEEQIEATVKEYQEYESGIVTEIGNKESYITLVSLYPELKADTLVSKQIELYLNNNQIIIYLKNQKLNEKIYRWWLYFGS